MNKLKVYVLYPFLVFSLVFIWIVVLISLGIETNQTWVWICGLLIVILGVSILAKCSKPTTINQGAKIGVVWSLLFILFDALTVVPLEGWSYYADLRVFLPYLVPMVLLPLIASLEKSRLKETAHKPYA